MTKKQSPVGEFLDGFKSGYDEQDKKIKGDKADLPQKIKESIATGTTESAFNPFNWVRAFFR